MSTAAVLVPEQTVQQTDSQNVKSHILTAQQRAIELWAADREVFGRSQESAKALGVALVEVKAVMPHGDFKPWLKAQGIDRNRATYCMRKASGKVAKKKAAPKVIELKPGMLIRRKDETFVVKDVRFFDQKEMFFELSVEVQEEERDPEWLKKLDAQIAADFEPTPPTPHDGPPKVEFDASELNKALRRLGAVRAHRDEKYKMVRIVAGRVELVGPESSLSITLKARTFGDFKVLIDYDELAPAIKNLTGSITITEDGAVQSGGLTSTVRCVPSDAEVVGFPIEEAAVNRVEGINLAVLKAQYELVGFAIPPPDGRLVTSALISSQNGVLRMVATNGKSVVLSDKVAGHGDFSFPIHKDALEIVHKMDGALLDITETEAFWRFTTKTETLVCRKTHVEFPPYQRVLPEHHDGWTKITVDAGALASALKRLRPHADEYKPGVLFTVGTGALLLEADQVEWLHDPAGFHYTERRTASESIKVVLVDGSPVMMRLNVNLVLPFLDRVKGDVEFYVKESTTKPVDCFAPACDGYRFLVMPMRDNMHLDGKSYETSKAEHEQKLKEKAARDAVTAVSVAFPDDEPLFMTDADAPNTFAQVESLLADSEWTPVEEAVTA